MMFYSYFFRREDISPSEGIVYSELLYQAFSHSPEIYDEEGKFNRDNAIAVVQNNIDMYGEAKLFYHALRPTQLADKVEMTLPTIRRILRSFKDRGIIDNHYIQCPLELLDDKFFMIPKGTGLRGQQLVFYGYLLNQAKLHHGVVGDWAYKLARKCNLKEGNIYFLIHELHENGFVERQKGGMLKVFEDVVAKKSDKTKGNLPIPPV